MEKCEYCLSYLIKMRRKVAIVALAIDTAVAARTGHPRPLAPSGQKGHYSWEEPLTILGVRILSPWWDTDEDSPRGSRSHEERLRLLVEDERRALGRPRLMARWGHPALRSAEKLTLDWFDHLAGQPDALEHVRGDSAYLSGNASASNGEYGRRLKPPNADGKAERNGRARY